MTGERVEQAHHACNDLDRRLGGLGGHALYDGGTAFSLILYDEIHTDNRPLFKSLRTATLAVTRSTINMATRPRNAPATGEARPARKNYVTPRGYARLQAELLRLLDAERPELVKTVAWAAANGDRSENADYIYGKKRLREIDRRIHYLTRQLDAAEIVDPAQRSATDLVYFGATVVYTTGTGARHTVTIVGKDEADPARGEVSWLSPLAQALMRHRVGEVTLLPTPAGEEELEIVEVRYERVS
jgi:transcription elongation factor GreB